jgi:hypothetical protein
MGRRPEFPVFPVHPGDPQVIAPIDKPNSLLDHMTTSLTP